MPINVAHIHTNPEWGGGENQVYQLVTRQQLSREVEVTVFLHGDGVLRERLVDSGVNVVPLALGLSARAQARNLRASFESAGIDLIHAHDSKALDMGIQLKKRCSLPLVLSRRISSPLRNNFFSLRKYSRGNIDGVIAISNTVKRVFSQSGYPERDIYIANDGLDFEALATVEPCTDLLDDTGKTFLVGGLGKLSKKKNWPFLVRVAEYLKNQEVDLRWVIAGDGEEEGALSHLISECGLEGRVQLLGFRRDASEVIKALDLLFFPSLMEGASVTIREAMAQSVPVVTVDAEGSVESLDGHGWVVSDGEVEAAGQAVLEALTHKEMREQKIVEARQSALDRFDILRTVRDTLSVYERVIRER